VGSILEEMKEITQYLKSSPDRIEKTIASVKCQVECFVELRVEPGPGCQAQSTASLDQSRFSKTVLFNGVYYCKSGKMVESKFIYQRMDIIQCRLLKTSRCVS
jgi:hypothetical protein